MKSIFVSHVDREKELAQALVTFIREVLDEPLRPIFLSSDIQSLRPGDKWEDKIRAAVLSCDVFIAMCSEKSFASHWIHLETGAAWAAGKTIIPVCYMGKKKGSLPRPYSSFTAVDLPAQASDLALTLHHLLELKTLPPIPHVRAFFDEHPQKAVYSRLSDAFSAWML